MWIGKVITQIDLSSLLTHNCELIGDESSLFSDILNMIIDKGIESETKSPLDFVGSEEKVEVQEKSCATKEKTNLLLICLNGDDVTDIKSQEPSKDLEKRQDLVDRKKNFASNIVILPLSELPPDFKAGLLEVGKVGVVDYIDYERLLTNPDLGLEFGKLSTVEDKKGEKENADREGKVKVLAVKDEKGGIGAILLVSKRPQEGFEKVEFEEVEHYSTIRESIVMSEKKDKGEKKAPSTNHSDRDYAVEKEDNIFEGRKFDFRTIDVEKAGLNEKKEKDVLEVKKEEVDNLPNKLEREELEIKVNKEQMNRETFLSSEKEKEKNFQHREEIKENQVPYLAKSPVEIENKIGQKEMVYAKQGERNIDLPAQQERILIKKEGTNTVTLFMHKEELGEIKIRLTIENGIVKAEIYPHTVEARQYFLENFEKITAMLNSDGINLGQFTLKQNERNDLGKENLSDREDNGNEKKQPVVKVLAPYKEKGLSIYA